MVVSALVNARRNPDAAAQCRSVIDGRPVVVSFVTVTEMRFGAINAGWGETGGEAWNVPSLGLWWSNLTMT